MMLHNSVAGAIGGILSNSMLCWYLKVLLCLLIAWEAEGKTSLLLVKCILTLGIEEVNLILGLKLSIIGLEIS
jgi:hypothetical protein